MQGGGHVLAGGQSSRMGREKALLELGGKPLIEHAVRKLRRVCGDVAILSSNPALARYAPPVPDLHAGCGPMGGMEAALSHTAHQWNLFLPVDVPFLPAAFLAAWLDRLPEAEASGVRVWIFTVEGVAQPTVALLHREVRPFLTEALESGQFKLLPVLERAAFALGERDSGEPGAGLRKEPHWEASAIGVGLTEAQRRGRELWFANLNTPEEFAQAELHVDAVDT